MNPEEISKRFRSGNYTANDIERVRNALLSSDTAFLDKTITRYIEAVETPDIDALLVYLETGTGVYTLSQIISGPSYRRCKDRRYIAHLLRFAVGAHADQGDAVRLQAIFSLPRVVEMSNEIKAVLKAAWLSDNVIVSNAALVAAQQYFGVPAPDIKWGDAADISDEVPAGLLEWLKATAH